MNRDVSTAFALYEIGAELGYVMALGGEPAGSDVNSRGAG